jgi:hypothetical protein
MSKIIFSIATASSDTDVQEVALSRSQCGSQPHPRAGEIAELSLWQLPPIARMVDDGLVTINAWGRLLAELRRCDMASDEEVGRQILGIFMQYKVPVGGVLRRNHFMEVRDADFQRGLNKAVENRWLTIKPHDRYTYLLTDVGLAAGLSRAAASNAV